MALALVVGSPILYEVKIEILPPHGVCYRPCLDRQTISLNNLPYHINHLQEWGIIMCIHIPVE